MARGTAHGELHADGRDGTDMAGASGVARSPPVDRHCRGPAATLNRDPTSPTDTPEEFIALLQAHGVSAAPVYTAQDIYEDEHLNARHAWVHLDHPVVGNKPVGGLPWHLEPGPAEQYWPAPTLGQHTQEVLGELGLSHGEIAVLRRDGIVA